MDLLITVNVLVEAVLEQGYELPVDFPFSTATARSRLDHLSATVIGSGKSILQ